MLKDCKKGEEEKMVKFSDSASLTTASLSATLQTESDPTQRGFNRWRERWVEITLV